MAKTTLFSRTSQTLAIGSFASPNLVLSANPFDIIRMTFTPTGTVAPNFTMKVGFYRLDSGIFVPIASVTADAGFATGGPQYLQFGAQPVVGQTIQAQLVIAGSAVTTAILIEGGLSSDFPR